MIQRARRMAKAVKTGSIKKERAMLVENDFAKLTYRARQLARRVARPKIKNTTTTDTALSRNLTAVRGVCPNTVSNAEGVLAVSIDTSAGCSVSSRLSTKLQPLSDASVEECLIHPVHPGIERPTSAQAQAQILPPISLALLQSQRAITAVPRALPAMSSSMQPGVMWSRPDQEHMHIIRTIANVLLPQDRGMAQQRSGAAPHLVPVITRPIHPPLSWLIRAQIHAQGAPPSLLGSAWATNPASACAGLYKLRGAKLRNDRPLCTCAQRPVRSSISALQTSRSVGERSPIQHTSQARQALRYMKGTRQRAAIAVRRRPKRAPPPSRGSPDICAKTRHIHTTGCRWSPFRTLATGCDVRGSARLGCRSRDSRGAVNRAFDMCRAPARPCLAGRIGMGPIYRGGGGALL